MYTCINIPFFLYADSFPYYHDEISSSGNSSSTLDAETDLEEWLSPPVIDASMRWDSLAGRREHLGKDGEKDRNSNGIGQYSLFCSPYLEDTPLTAVSSHTYIHTCMHAYIHI